MRPIPPEYEFFRHHSKVDYLWENNSCEIVFFNKVMKLILKDPIAQGFHFYIVNEEPLPKKGSDVIAIQIGLEDHRIPDYAEEVGLVFTTYPPEGRLPDNLKNIPLGYNGDLPNIPFVSFPERKTSAYFSGQNSNERWQIGAAVNSVISKGYQKDKSFEINYSKKFRTGLSPDAYAYGLMNAKIAFAPRGTQSPITFRLFEAARAGNVIIACRLPKVWYFDEFPGIQLDDWTELDQVLIDLLEDENKMQAIHEKTLTFYKRYCSEQAVANYIIEQIKKKCQTKFK